MKVKLYVEGGGDHNKDLDVRCRKGFRKFLENTKLFDGRIPGVVSCGGRKQAYDDFRAAVARQEALPFLLVDSEGPIEAKTGPWDHVYRRNGDHWQRPARASDEQLHFMVEAMEAWLHADREAIAKFYGKDFHDSALSARPHPESIPKAELFRVLAAATRRCAKGEYSKGGHAFELLALIDPAKVRATCPHADRMVTTLHKYC